MTDRMTKISLLLLAIFLTPQMSYSNELALTDALSKALSNSHEIVAFKMQANSDKALIVAQYALRKPKVGISILNRNIETQYWTIGQEIEFPTKYFIRAARQSNLAKASVEKYEQAKLRVRAEVLSAYYKYYSLTKILALKRTDLQKIKEFSRIAESKYASGKVPQQDMMKSHFAQTQVETNLIILEQERISALAELSLALNIGLAQDTQLKEEDLYIPNFNKLESKLKSIDWDESNYSHHVKAKRHEVESVRNSKNLALWDYAPDFNVKYQQRYAGSPTDSKIISFEMSMPLWFWGQSSKVSAANSQLAKAESQLNHVQYKVGAKILSLKAMAEAQGKLLDIYQTGLIPQALTSFNSSQAAYRANRIGFLGLLDSERSYVEVQINYFRTLSDFMTNMAKMEALLGYELLSI